MDIATTYKIFLIKTLKEKRYYWTRNIFFVLFPLLFITTYIFSGVSETSQSSRNEESRTYPSISEVSLHTHPAAYGSKNRTKLVFLSRLTTSDFRKSFMAIFRRGWTIKSISCPTQHFIQI